MSTSDLITIISICVTIDGMFVSLVCIWLGIRQLFRERGENNDSSDPIHEYIIRHIYENENLNSSNRIKRKHDK